MAALLNIQNNIFYLDSINQRYRLLYPKLPNLNEDERKELENIKKESLETLGQILSNDCNDVLKENFNDKVKLLNQGILSVLNEKKAELERLENKSEQATNVIESIAQSVCKIETLENNASLRIDIEKLLFYLKNKVTTISVIDKKLYALEYLRDKLDNYRVGLYKLVMLAKKHPSKAELSFEEKQEIFDAFSSISFEYHYDINHSKVFNEDLTDKTLNLNTFEYIEWIENLFIDMLDSVGVKLESYLTELINLVNEAGATKVNIENYINFLGKKYDSDIVTYYDSLVEKKIENVTDIRTVLKNSLSYDKSKNIKHILSKINKNRRLPDPLISSSYKGYLENLLFEFEPVNEIEEVNETVLKQVADIMFEKFDPQKYLEIYEYNTKQKNKQIMIFTHYLEELLGDAKSVLKLKYVNDLENSLEENMLQEYNTSKSNNEQKNRQKDITVLTRALDNIKGRFSEFDDYSYKRYINSIEETYGVKELSTEISIRRKTIFGFKAKVPNKKDLGYIENFLKQEDINRNLIKNIAYDVIIGNDSLRFEVLSKVLL